MSNLKVKALVVTVPSSVNYNIRVTTSVHIKFSHWVALKAIAKKTNRSMSDVVNYILDVVFSDCDSTCNALIKLIGTDDIMSILEGSTE